MSLPLVSSCLIEFFLAFQLLLVVLSCLFSCFVSCLCRAGQELEPSAALLPIKDALASLQSSLQSRPSSNPLGPVTQDLLQHLSQAALFQELCNGDLQAVPGLMTPGSRLTCLVQLLQDEASTTAAGTIADSATECEAASGGSGESSVALLGGLTLSRGSAAAYSD